MNPKFKRSEVFYCKKQQRLKWDVDNVQLKLKKVFDNNSEHQLLELLKNNSFLFYELFSRKCGQQIFHEISFGGKFRCDFAWLNDNSDGPEWVLVEIEKPNVQLFKKQQKHELTADFNHAINQVESWDKYFFENPTEKKRIFGAVVKFRYILVIGNTDNWSSENAIKWRAYHNQKHNIEIRTMSVFQRALDGYKTKPDDFWGFENRPFSLPHSELEKFWTEYGYINFWRKVL